MMKYSDIAAHFLMRGIFMPFFSIQIADKPFAAYNNHMLDPDKKELLFLFCLKRAFLSCYLPFHQNNKTIVDKNILRAAQKNVSNFMSKPSIQATLKSC